MTFDNEISTEVAKKPWRKLKFDGLPTCMIKKAFTKFNEEC
jgi:hypothetical protein